MSNKVNYQSYVFWLKRIAKDVLPKKLDLEHMKELPSIWKKLGFFLGRAVFLFTYPISVPLIAGVAYWAHKQYFKENQYE